MIILDFMIVADSRLKKIEIIWMASKPVHDKVSKSNTVLSLTKIYGMRNVTGGFWDNV